MDSMDLDWETDQMEYEYTHPPQKANNIHIDRKPPIIDGSTFKIPESFLEHNYKESSFLTTAVCSLLDKFTLNDGDKDTMGVSTATASEQSGNALVLRKAPQNVKAIEDSHFPLTDESPALSPSLSPQPVAPDSQSIDKPEAPSTPLPLSNSPSPYSHSAASGAVPNDKTSANIPSYTFIYNAYSNSEPLDPLNEQRGAIYFLFGIFRLVCASILFIGTLYIIAQFFKYVQHDMKAKIVSYESDLLGNQMYCQHQYELNRCSPQTRLPAIADLCRDWEKCMFRPLAVSKTKVLAELAAEMWNGFTKTLTVKSMILNILAGSAVLVILSNIIPSILAKNTSTASSASQISSIQPLNALTRNMNSNK